VHFDKTGQHVEEKRAFRRLERRQDAFLRGTRRGAQAIVQRLAARCQSQRAGRGPVRGLTRRSTWPAAARRCDKVMRAHRTIAQAAARLLWSVSGTSDSATITANSTGVRIGALGNLCRNAQADLMEAPRQVGGDPLTLWTRFSDVFATPLEV